MPRTYNPEPAKRGRRAAARAQTANAPRAGARAKTRAQFQHPDVEARGPHYRANRALFEHYEQALGRQTRRGGPTLWPLPREETPFGTVTTSDAAGNDFTAARDRKVSYINSRRDDYLGSKGWFRQYRQLAKHLTPEMAADILIEVYDTLARSVGPGAESQDARQRRCRKAQKRYRDAYRTKRLGTSLRVMAILYALTLFSEEQRNAGGKAARAALRRVASRKRTARQVYVGDDRQAPDLPQGRSLTTHRDTASGQVRATKGQEALGDEFSDASAVSDDEDQAGRQASFARQRDALRKRPLKRKRPSSNSRQSQGPSKRPRPDE